MVWLFWGDEGGAGANARPGTSATGSWSCPCFMGTTWGCPSSVGPSWLGARRCDSYQEDVCADTSPGRGKYVGESQKRQDKAFF